MRVKQASKHELAGAVRERYLRADRRGKAAILDEFVASTGYHRKAAIRLLRQGPP
ncbi:MAG: transposase, partial [Chloroflexota bacterium]